MGNRCKDEQEIWQEADVSVIEMAQTNFTLYKLCKRTVLLIF